MTPFHSITMNTVYFKCFCSLENNVTESEGSSQVKLKVCLDMYMTLYRISNFLALFCLVNLPQDSTFDLRERYFWNS